MYYICKFRTNWSLFNDAGTCDQALDPSEVIQVKAFFPGLLEEAKMLSALQIAPLPTNKRQQPVATENYVISKSFSKWSIYDGKRQADRELDTEEIAWIKRLVPDLTSGAGNYLELIVSPVLGKKLLGLPLGGTSFPPVKTQEKTPELAKKPANA